MRKLSKVLVGFMKEKVNEVLIGIRVYCEF